MIHFASKIILILSVIVSFTACKNDDDAARDPFAENRKNLGQSAEDLLQNDRYSSLTVELVYTSTTKPSEEAIDNFRDFLEARLNKPGLLLIKEREISSPSGSPYNLDEIRDIEETHRTEYNEDDTIAVYVFFANGKSTNDTDTSVTLGTAYRNTSIVIYQQTLQTLISNNPGSSLPVLESTTLQHEFGHILGLVNITDDDIHTEHEDTDNNRHCMVENCLMYFEASNINRDALRSYLRSQNNIPQLDPLCIEDLQAKGGL